MRIFVNKEKKNKRGRRGMTTCLGCQQPFNADLISTSSCFCLDCKRALDRLATLANAQGDSSVRFATQNLVTSYWQTIWRITTVHYSRERGARAFYIPENSQLQ
eukprot:4698522-Amphidinium_carterae.1